MKHNYFTFSHNPELDEFRKETGFLTNFDYERLGQYKAAVEAYKEIAPEVVLEIGDGWRYYRYALYMKSARQDLSKFWEIFNSLKAEV